MIRRSVVFLFLMVGSLIWVWASMATESQTPDRPKAVAPEPRYEFPTAVEGTVVIHDFIIENHGTATLNIKKIDSG